MKADPAMPAGPEDAGCEILQAVFCTEDPSRFVQELRRLARTFGIAIVSFDAEKMAGRAHVEAALRHARRSCRRGDCIASSFEMEALLYAAGTRQCALAAGFGVHAGWNRAYIALCPPSPPAAAALEGLVAMVEEDWEILPAEKRRRLADLFGITPQEIEAAGPDRIPDLVLERVALLDVLK
ncbi:MAG: KEOPS complex subunit Cgi121 [Methanomicrobiales archaeon]|nr:KEOPS complex subunit Cgi121 [Methanomicrobiales archaeon]